MKKKFPFGLFLTLGGLLAVSALCVLTMFGTFQWLRQNSPGWDFSVNRNQGTAEETLTFDPEDAIGVRMDWSYGNISVKQTDGDLIQMELEKISWGESQTDANQNAEALTVDVNGDNDWLVFSFQQPDKSNTLVIQDSVSQINVVMYLPEGINLELDDLGGTINVHGFRGDVVITNRVGGGVYVSDHIGGLSVESNNGTVDVAQINAGEEPVRFVSQFGDVILEDVSAGDVEVESQNGEIVTLGLIASGVCQVNSGFGATAMHSFSCAELSVNSQNGSIDLENGKLMGDLTIYAEFGGITLTQVYAENYTMESSNGDILADRIAGNVTVSGAFGEIDLANGEDCVLDIKNDNGSIAYSGSLFSGKNHTIINQFGSVTLEIPEDTNLDIDLKTDFGVIETEFPVTLQGQIDPTAMVGQINAGGELLKIETTNGDIVLKALQ